MEAKLHSFLTSALEKHGVIVMHLTFYRRKITLYALNIRIVGPKPGTVAMAKCLD
jgi:hypothetical protein